MGGAIRSAPLPRGVCLFRRHAAQLAPATIGRSDSISMAREGGLPLTCQTVDDYHADRQSIPCPGNVHSICCRTWQVGGAEAQTCSGRSYDQKPWRSFLLLGSSCMNTAGCRPERMGEIMYGVTKVGSLMRRSLHTKTPPCLPPRNPAPAGKLCEADHGPDSSVRTIDNITLHHEHTPIEATRRHPHISAHLSSSQQPGCWCPWPVRQ